MNWKEWRVIVAFIIMVMALICAMAIIIYKTW